MLRITNTDQAIIERTVHCLSELGFDAVIDDYGRPNGVKNVRVRGGLSERLRFFHAVDPAITRKREIAGTGIRSKAPLRVVAIEPLGRDLELIDIGTGSGSVVANGLITGGASTSVARRGPAR